jgi:hypothetical protein
VDRTLAQSRRLCPSCALGGGAGRDGSDVRLRSPVGRPRARGRHPRRHRASPPEGVSAPGGGRVTFDPAGAKRPTYSGEALSAPTTRMGAPPASAKRGGVSPHAPMSMASAASASIIGGPAVKTLQSIRYGVSTSPAESRMLRVRPLWSPTRRAMPARSAPASDESATGAALPSAFGRPQEKPATSRVKAANREPWPGILLGQLLLICPFASYSGQ